MQFILDENICLVKCKFIKNARDWRDEYLLQKKKRRKKKIFFARSTIITNENLFIKPIRSMEKKSIVNNCE